MPLNSRIQVLAPLIKDRKGNHQAVFDDVRKAGTNSLHAGSI
jgi:excinuclease UvrABC ATPase subunit